MPNEQTSVPLFASGEVLTASNLNLSAGTGVPVFASTTTRDAAFGGANEKVLAEGQLCYLSSTNIVQYYDGAAWATVGPATAGALTLISSTTIGTTVSSVTVSSAFSATYDNYLLMVTGGTSSADVALRLTLGSTITGYYYGLIVLTYAGTSSVVSGANTTSYYAGECAASSLILNCEVKNPFNTKTTSFNSTIGANRTDGYALNGAGYLNNTTSYTAFTLTPASGTITGGTIRVYGYANS